MNKLLFLILLLSFAFNTQANNANLMIDSANSAYQNGEFELAIKYYTKVCDSGNESFELYYNLGNAYYKSNHIPAAILFYEKAKILEPSNEDLLYNLNVSNSKITDKIEIIESLFFVRWWKSFCSMYSIDGWAKIGLILFLVFLVFTILFLLTKVYLIKKISFYTGVIILLMSISSVSIAYKQHITTKNQRIAIVFSPTVTVKASPKENSTNLFVIHEGLKVEIINMVGDWYEIRLADGHKGWLEMKTIELI